jgi:hypothetical protein
LTLSPWIEETDAWGQLDPAFTYNGLQMIVGRKSPDDPMAENMTQVD